MLPQCGGGGEGRRAISEVCVIQCSLGESCTVIEANAVNIYVAEERLAYYIVRCCHCH